jgi:hypothetical protein
MHCGVGRMMSRARGGDPPTGHRMTTLTVPTLTGLDGEGPQAPDDE